MVDGLHILVAAEGEGDADEVVDLLKHTTLDIRSFSIARSINEASSILLKGEVNFVFTAGSLLREVEVLELFLSKVASSPLIIFTETQENDFDERLKLCADDFLDKQDFTARAIQRCVALILERRANSELKEKLSSVSRTFLNSNPLPTWAFNPSTLRIKAVNDAAVKHYGYSREEFLRLTLRDLRREDDLRKFDEFLHMFHGTAFDSRGTHWTHLKKNGEKIDVELATQQIEMNGEQLVLAVITDVTGRNRAFQQLQESKERLDLAVASARMAVLDVNYQSGAVRLFTHPRSPMASTMDSVVDLDSALSFVHPDDRLKVELAFELGSIGKGEDVQFRVIRPDNGKTMWVERRSSIVFDEKGKAIENRGILVDITALKQTQGYLLDSFRQLEEAAAQQNSILNSLPAHIALLDNDGTIIAVNEAWRRFAQDNGVPGVNYCEGESYFTAGASDGETQLIYEAIREVIAGKRTGFELEYPCHSPLQKRWFKAIVSPLVTKEKRGAVVMHINVTDRKTAEEELVRSRANLLSIFQNTPDAYVLIDPDYHVIAANNQALNKFYFLRGKDPVGKSVLSLLPPDRVDAFSKHVKIASTGVPVEYAAVYDAQDGKRYFQFRITPILSLSKAVLGYSVCGHDVTRQKEIENALRESEEHFRALIENSGDMFCVADLQNRITYISPNIQKHLLYDASEILMRPFDELVHHEDLERYMEVLRLVYANENKIYGYSCRISDRNGRWMWVEGTMTNLISVSSVRGVVINFRDVTDRLRTEEQLRQSKYLLENAYKVAMIGHWVAELGATPSISISPQLNAILGREESAVSIADVESISSDSYLSIVQDALSAVMMGEREFNLDHKVVCADGKIVWLHQQVQVFSDEEGNLVSVVGVAKDITERKTIEDNVRQAKNNLDALINNTTDLLWSCDVNLRLVSANKTFRESVKLQYDIEISEGDSVLLMNSQSDDLEFWRDRYQQALDGQRVDFEIDFHDDNGKRWFFEVTLNPIRDGEKVEGVSGFTRNITEKKEIENRIRQSHERFELLSLATNDAVWDWDINSNTLYWNHGLKTIYGHELPDRKSTLQWWEDNIHPLDRAVLKQTLSLAFANMSRNWSANYRFKTSDGNYRHTHDRGYIIYEEGVPLRMIGGMQDVHELTEYRVTLEQKVFERTRDLHQALQKEKELSEMKNRFVSIASHEFRTPLSTIQFAADYLKMYRSKLSDEQITRKLKSIESQVAHMMTLLDDVLTVGKGDSGRIQLNKSVIDLRQFFTDLVSNVRYATKSTHEVKVSFNVRTHLVESDEKLLYNIFSNLISNAIKFSPAEREVSLSFSEEEGMLVCDVGDNGIGIDPQEIDFIFEPFNRGKNAQAISGTGLGLSIVRTAVNLLQGTIHVQSNTNFKTLFTVRLPIHLPGAVLKEEPSHDEKTN